MGTVVCWASFGYCLNDIADLGDDRRAGKHNRAADVSRFACAAFLAACAIIALGLSILWAADAAAPTLVAAGLLLATVYSARPVRLKERGAIGLIAGAVSQWVLPTLAISGLRPDGWKQPAAWCVAFLGCAIGVRWMAIHQLQDRAADRRAGVVTFASVGGRMWPVLVAAFVSEIVLLVAALALTYPQSTAPVIALAFWIAQEALLRPRGEPMRHRLEGYDHAPLAEYYFALLPLALALTRLGSSPIFLLFAVAFAVLGWCYFGMMTGEWYEAWNERTHDR